MKKKLILITSILTIACSGLVLAKIEDKEEDFSENTDFIEQFVKDEEALTSARNKSRNLLESKPNIITLRDSEEKLLQEDIKKREELARKIDEKKYLEDKKKMTFNDVTTRLQKAPFGLYWGATVDEIKTIGFTLNSTEREDYTESYIVSNPVQQHTSFNPIIISFGLQNHLWCIYAQSTPQADGASASKLLKLYRQYYKALAKKYGNPQETFTPYSYIEEKVEGEGNEQVITQITHTMPLGGENFLEELYLEKASLSATFKGNNLGITLTARANEKGESFITIDYKNLPIMQNEQKSNLENIMDDL